MRPALILSCKLILLTAVIAQAQPGPKGTSDGMLLPNGWSLTPAGTSIPLGDLPLNIAIAPNNRLAAVTNNGQSTQSVQLIDLATRKVLDTRVIKKSWLGLAFGDNSRSLYASGGNDNLVVRFRLDERTLSAADTFFLGKPWPEKISPAGLTADEKAGRLYVVTKEDHALYIFDTRSRAQISKIALGTEGYTCLLSPDRKTLFISGWGADAVLVFDTRTMSISHRIPVGDNPNDMAITRNGQTLFVANANDNSVSVIDLVRMEVTGVIQTALHPDSPPGSTTNSVALGNNDRTLYIANADNNCVAVFDLSVRGTYRSAGFIPVGWYPTCVRTVGKTLLVANGKGFSSLANPDGPNPAAKREIVGRHVGDSNKPKQVQYIGGLFKGTLSFIPSPEAGTLSAWTKQVYRNTPYTGKAMPVSTWAAENPIPSSSGKSSPIKHVFYILKENRTYDQVLGDVPGGNGDTTLVLFGRKITPNQHALAEQFVLLDNFYVNGEVSADGHNWSMGAYATDYLEKTWPTSYGGRGGSYDSEGNRAVANNKGGFIWDVCKRMGVSYRTYGEFADNGKANIPALEGHVCSEFTGWDESVPDTVRFAQWKKDFDRLIATGTLPQLNTLRFINDHTEGLRLGRPTPFAHVADNDRAVGLFVEYLSKSPIWNESVVFITEDDAQNGPDHVDAHRSTLYIAGGRVKRGFVDHTMYSTASILRTIELLLGLPPMSQYDASAEPLWRCFSPVSDPSGFRSLIPETDRSAVNTAMNHWQRRSEQFNFRKEDSAPDDEFNRVLWWAVKGDRNYPAPRYAAFFKPAETEDDD